jgi:hypothetical protein
MVRPHAACCLKRLEPPGGIPTMDEFVNGLPDDLTFSVSQNLTEPRDRSVFLLCDISEFGPYIMLYRFRRECQRKCGMVSRKWSWERGKRKGMLNKIQSRFDDQSRR